MMPVNLVATVEGPYRTVLTKIDSLEKRNVNRPEQKDEQQFEHIYVKQHRLQQQQQERPEIVVAEEEFERNNLEQKYLQDHQCKPPQLFRNPYMEPHFLLETHKENQQQFIREHRPHYEQPVKVYEEQEQFPRTEYGSSKQFLQSHQKQIEQYEEFQQKQSKQDQFEQLQQQLKVKQQERNQVLKIGSGKPPLPPRPMATCRSKIINARHQFFNRIAADNGRTKLASCEDDDDSMEPDDNEAANKRSLERFRQRAQAGIERAAKSVLDLQSILRRQQQEKQQHQQQQQSNLESVPLNRTTISITMIEQKIPNNDRHISHKNHSSCNRRSDGGQQKVPTLQKERCDQIILHNEENGNNGHYGHSIEIEAAAEQTACRAKRTISSASQSSFSTSSSSSANKNKGKDEEIADATEEIWKECRTERSPSISYLETDIDTLHSREVILIIKNVEESNDRRPHYETKQSSVSPSNNNNIRNHIKAKSMLNLCVGPSSFNDDNNVNDQLKNVKSTSGYYATPSPTTEKQLGEGKEEMSTFSINSSSSASVGGTRIGVASPLSSASSSRAKSMEFLLNDEDKSSILPPENQLQRQQPTNDADDGDFKGHHLSEHELRFRRSLQKLNLPEWYKNSPLAKQGSTEGLLLLDGERQQRRINENAGRGLGRWEDLRSRSSSVTSLGEGASNQRGGFFTSKRVITPNYHHVKSSQESLPQSSVSLSLPPSPGASLDGTGTSIITGTGIGTREKSSYFPYYNPTGISRWCSSRLSCSTTFDSSRCTSPTGSVATASPAPITSRSSQFLHRTPYLGWRSSERLNKEKMQPFISDNDNSNTIGAGSGSFYRSAAERLSQGQGYYAMRFGRSGETHRNIHADRGSNRINDNSSAMSSTGGQHLSAVSVKGYKPKDGDQPRKVASTPPEHIQVAAELSREIDKMINRGNGFDNHHHRHHGNRYQAVESL